MGFWQDVLNELKYKSVIENYSLLQKKMENRDRNDRSGYDSASKKITLGEDAGTSEESKRVTLVHERIHKQISGAALINIAYYELTQIYDVLINLFLEQYSKELQVFLRRHGVLGRKLNAYTEQYMILHMNEFLHEMSTNEKIAKYCEFCVEFRRRCEALLTYTGLVQEGTATWCMLHADYSRIASETEQRELDIYIQQQKAVYTNPEYKGNVYYDGYQTAGELAGKYGADSLVELAILALSPPRQDFATALFHCSGTEFDVMLRERFCCDEAWKKLKGLELPSDFQIAKQWNELYCAMYAADFAQNKKEFAEFWEEKTIIDAINRLEGRTLISGSIRDYVDSGAYVAKKPMPYTKTKKIILDSDSEQEARDAVIRYHRDHKHSWGTPWEEDPEAEFANEYDENQRIHHENITNMMKDVVRFSKEG